MVGDISVLKVDGDEYRSVKLSVLLLALIPDILVKYVNLKMIQ